MSILYCFILIPVLTITGILFTKDVRSTRVVAASGMFLQLIMAVVLLFMFFAQRHAGNTAEMLFLSDHSWFPTLNIRFTTGVDGIAVSMILLTATVVFAGIFASWEMEDLAREFFISLIILATGVFGFFISVDLFTMFMFYELAVIPMYLLIGIWGSGSKEYSAMKLTLMLMGGSALLMVGLFGIYFNSTLPNGQHTFNILQISKVSIPLAAQRYFFPFTFVGFGVLGALFPLHTWSPDGHASAPTAVSMLHAGVLMKLGGYGCLRVIWLMPEGAKLWGTFFLALTTVNIFYGALVACKKTDLKYITAYSSVSHCGLVIFGLATLNQTAFQGAVVQMFAHGLMTALFFALIGMIYGRTHTRFITEMGGLLKVMPYLGVCYMIGGMAGLGLPGLAGFVAEVQVFVAAFQDASLSHRVMTVLAASSVVTTAVYLLRALTRMLYGPIRDPHHLELTDATMVERVPLAILVFFLAFAGIFPMWMIKLISSSVAPVVARIVAAG